MDLAKTVIDDVLLVCLNMNRENPARKQAFDNEMSQYESLLKLVAFRYPSFGLQ